MPIAELFLGAFLQVLFDRLASLELLDFVRREGFDTRLKKWQDMLTDIKGVLDDAEDRQLTGDDRVNLWLKDLRNLAYDIEDLLDEFATESVENKSKEEPGTSKARSLLPSCCVGLSSTALMFGHKMRSEIDNMDGRLQEITDRINGLKLIENKEKQSTYRQLDKPIPTTNVPERCFVSREDEKKEILKLLTRKEDDRTNFTKKKEDDRTSVDLEVIAIEGMAGVGKTALAQQVYNDASLTFDTKIWVCVSDNFDVFSITKDILEATDCHLSCEDKALNWLQDKLKENLSGKKLLIIFDDVWNTIYENWTILVKPFQSGAKGSKIIITTRDHGMALMVGARTVILEVLSLDECMEMFAFHALGVRNFNQHSNLKELGRKIAEKCKGLPLAVKALAGLLRNKVQPHEWEAILRSKIWDLQEGLNILPALKLSYLHLPSHLRRCFAYCAIFPKDYKFQRDELIHWWIAEGLVKEKEGMDCCNVGLKYFNELVSRSLFQKSRSSESRFLMHDLVNDLAKLVAGASHFSSREFKWDQYNPSLARHASFLPSLGVTSKKLEIYHGMKRLRSFISLGKQFSHHEGSSLSQKVLCDLLLALKYLRVLSLSHYNIQKIPDCIGELRLLRHLDLSYTAIKTLPKSIVALYNLEALMLRGCKFLVELPKCMEKLINLRFLDITDTRRLKATPLYISKLVGLEMMSKFVVGTGNGSRLEELKDLESLGGELCISNLHMVRKAKDARDANLCMKKGICRLTMEWSTDFQNSRNGELEREVLDLLCPHRSLESLTISYYGGPKFPSWLGSPSHDNIVHLYLCRCQKVKALPSLGQLPLLKELYIQGLHAICTVGSEFYGSNSPFPSLIKLEFTDMPLWNEWSHCVGTEEVEVIFPCLEHLIICRCPMLIGRLPSQLSSLIKLDISSCPCMDASPSITSLPSLNELDFVDCKEGMLKSLVNLTSLTALCIENVPQLTRLNHGFTSSLSKLERLKIKICTELIYLWQDRDVIQDLACLKNLVVEGCSKFIYFVAEEGDVELPSNLETINLSNCVNLKKLSSQMHTLSSLRGLYIDGCDKLQSLPRGLGIHLDEPSSSSSSNTHSDMTSCLVDLKISGCNPLSAFPLSMGRFLPATLKRLQISANKRVESLAEISVAGLQSLQHFRISECENLRSLPQGLDLLSRLTSLGLLDCPALELECFPPLPPSISWFSLRSCPKIKSLPNELHRLTCLCYLAIESCESITRFPDEGLPPQLQTLVLTECGNIKQPVGEWLTPLTSLEWLCIDGSVGGVGEEEDLVLPLSPSLLDFRICHMEKVKRLSANLPPFLRRLLIHHCPKLRDLPRDGLPSSLEGLWIEGCGILRERCREPTGRYWPLIREIPYVGIDGIVI